MISDWTHIWLYRLRSHVPHPPRLVIRIVGPLILLAILALFAYGYIYFGGSGCSDAPDPAYCDELRQAPRVGN